MGIRYGGTRADRDDQQAKSMPNAEEIAQRAAEIRAGWDRKRRAKERKAQQQRVVYLPTPVLTGHREYSE